MGWWSTARAVAATLGVVKPDLSPVGCALGRSIYRETKRAAQVANVTHRPRALKAATVSRLRPVFPDLDFSRVRVRTRCRLPANRFAEGGSIYTMTFGSTIYFRDELDESDPRNLVKLIHELVHVDQVRRHGGESGFSCEYGRGYLAGGGDLPGYIDDVTAYHRNPLEAEAYRFEARFRDGTGRVDAGLLPPA